MQTAYDPSKGNMLEFGIKASSAQRERARRLAHVILWLLGRASSRRRRWRVHPREAPPLREMDGAWPWCSMVR